MKVLDQIAGFDSRLLKYCSTKIRWLHASIGALLLLNAIIFAIGIWFFFNKPVSIYIDITIVSSFTLIYVLYNRMIIATHDFSIDYYYKYQKLAPNNLGISIPLRMSVVVLFGVVATTGWILYFTNDFYLQEVQKLMAGEDSLLKGYSYIIRPETDFDELEVTISDRMATMKPLFGLYRYLLIIPYLLIMGLMIFPLWLKFYYQPVASGEYERLETMVETSMAVSNYLYAQNVIQLLSKYPSQGISESPPVYQSGNIPPIDKLL